VRSWRLPRYTRQVAPLAPVSIEERVESIGRIDVEKILVLSFHRIPLNMLHFHEENPGR
jgi:hypothetical protein